MLPGEDEIGNRLERRKQHTRAALVRAAQEFIAAGKFTVPVLEITRPADVGMGSFYNHFDSKQALFAAALDDIFDAYGALLDRLPQAHDPAETFARSFRLTGRLFRLRPQQSRALLNSGLSVILSDRGLAPRALRDITAADRAGRFELADPRVSLALAAAALMTLGQILFDDPARDDAQTTDLMAADLLRTYGVPPDEAITICRRPLPSLEDLAAPKTFGGLSIP